MRGVLWISSAIAVFLTFAWPFVVSSDPGSAAYRVLAIAALCGILFSIVILVARKALAAGRR